VGVNWALFSTSESTSTALTTNTFLSCQSQGADIGWLFGYTGSGLVLFNCNGESANTIGLYVADTASAYNTAVKAQGGEWSDVDASKEGALHMIGSAVNGTIGSDVLNEYYGRFLNTALQFNNIIVDGNTISSSGTNQDIIIDPNGTGGVIQGSTTRIARTHSQTGGSEFYRATATGTKGVVEVYSDVGGSGTLVAQIEANGDFESATNNYGALSDENLKQDIVDAGSQWDDIKSLHLKKYRMRNLVAQLGDGAPVHLGVVAQELEATGMGGLVDTKPINEDEPEGEQIKSVKYSILYLKAVKALQEAMVRIEALESKVSILEN
jgi:hypothetical protein